jgi:hypothetical protein
MSREELEKMVDALIKKASDKGQLIEVGWLSLRLVYDPKASESQVETLREAFFAGASHVFTSIMTVMDSDREPTAQDLRRMALIQSEIQEFISEFRFKHNLKVPR